MAVEADRDDDTLNLACPRCGMEMTTDTLDDAELTSHDWCHVLGIDTASIVDPDGWDRKDFGKSFYKETITQAEFNKRLSESSINITNIDM